MDSREQNPLSFDKLGVEKVEVAGLAFGDYSAIIHGKVVPIVFERKGISDLFGTLTAGHARFKREMERAREANFKLIVVIEGTYTDVWNGIPHSKMDGEQIIKILNTMYAKYDLEFWFCESRRVMARRIVDLYSAIERGYSDGLENAPF